MKGGARSPRFRLTSTCNQPLVVTLYQGTVSGERARDRRLLNTTAPTNDE